MSPVKLPEPEWVDRPDEVVQVDQGRQAPSGTANPTRMKSVALCGIE